MGRYGIRGLVIDPYNELDHQRAKNTTETEYVSQLLTKLKRFAQHYRCVVCPHPGALNQELPVGLDGGFCELGRKLHDSRPKMECIVVLVTSYFRFLASAPKVDWQAGAEAPARCLLTQSIT